MRFYEIDIVRPDLPRRWTGHIMTERTWTLPGVECPTCGETWSGQQMLPTVDVTDLPQQGLLRKPRVVPYAEFTALTAGLASRLPRGLAPEPGMQLGPLRGSAEGAFGPLTTQDGWDLLVREDALSRLQQQGLNGLIPVRLEVEGFGSEAPFLYELEFHVAGRLAPEDVQEGPQCPTCGWREVRISPEHALEADSLPNDLDVFLPVNATTYLMVTERFVQAAQRLGPSDLMFREVPLARR
ncbi:hypothetical protein D7W79_24305 [Corallococcus exercitus]|uniref:Uncharacterized protein n=1 Tax=Corallococcus exercitus TaxID=2316736 RepID=A0A3A8HTM9_9BACT|nr:double-CXXCG motif protein [Corallococcus exercitus]NOK37654.1 hypothetical protein [Corallococcus exercitus]RKG73928.1 hypothetical protein D7W79_24305 [Corallococcus exercitus]